MRIGQLARKHDIPVQEIISFLEEETGEKFHPNAKLFDAIEEKLFDRFDLSPDPIVEPADEVIPEASDDPSSPETKLDSEPETPEADIASVDGELEVPDPELTTDQSLGEIKEELPKPNEDEVIQTDKLLALLESEDTPADLDKIKLIKAPKKELSGLKVLGKVDLPEPKKKEEKGDGKSEQTDARGQRKRRPQLSEEEREKRRLKAKRKKEAYEARQEKRKKEQEAQRLKELKAKHYKAKIQKTPVKKTNKPTKQAQTESKITTQKESRPAPKTWIGKWWRWMNT
ncbi:hypothetical protein [Ekhidna sp.]|uniref:hypothetical protein n=1 Tax=Ekhidna sp. TaxID=2608089 RepID=UPI003CCBF9A3